MSQDKIRYEDEKDFRGGVQLGDGKPESSGESVGAAGDFMLPLTVAERQIWLGHVDGGTDAPDAFWFGLADRLRELEPPATNTPPSVRLEGSVLVELLNRWLEAERDYTQAIDDLRGNPADQDTVERWSRAEKHRDDLSKTFKKAFHAAASELTPLQESE